AGYYTFRLLSRVLSSERGRVLAAGIGGYVGLNVAAFTTAVMFGIQPLLHMSPDGRALYAPYPLSVALHAMMLQHMTIIGTVEALVTGLVVHSLHRSKSAWVLDSPESRSSR
ncbi:MAG: cobalamin biosynthesis protein CbiM, partial [Deltaproteobacteria bacterium]|nr:cobalamin biosynthesis protein CbiM [Deltaproteobacteria bacterium]